MTPPTPQTGSTPSGPPSIGGSRPTGGVEAGLYLHPKTLARLGTMELRAKMIVEGVTSGMHRSPYQGFSVEFAQHRPYVAGDDIRHLDWKVYGRSDKLYLKQYEQETNLDLVLLVDASGSMNYGSRSFASASGSGEKTSHDGRSNWTKYDHATATAAALAYVSLKQGDRVGTGIYADGLLESVARSGSQATWRRIVQSLSTQSVDRPTDLGRTIDQVLAKLNNRCLITLISDCFEDVEVLRSALARIRHRRHDAIVLQVLDRRELHFDLEETAPFLGLEGEGRLRLDPRAIRQDYLKAFNEHREAVEKTTKRFGFDYQLVDTHAWLGPPLATFIAKRNAMVKRRKRS